MKHFLVMAFLVLIFSCKEEVKDPPADRETMLFILRDMVLIEASVSLLKQDERDSVKTELKKELFSSYGWSESQLEELKTYLSENPEMSLELHDEVRTEIKRLEAEL